MGFGSYALSRLLKLVGRIIALFGFMALIFSYGGSADPDAPTIAMGVIVVGVIINWYGAYRLR